MPCCRSCDGLCLRNEKSDWCGVDGKGRLRLSRKGQAKGRAERRASAATSF